MPTNKNKCCSLVKTTFSSVHNNCKKTRPCLKKKGSYLNSFISKSSTNDNNTPFDPEMEYDCCYNLSLCLQTMKPNNVDIIESSITSARYKRTTDDTNLPSQKRSRAETSVPSDIPSNEPSEVPLIDPSDNALNAKPNDTLKRKTFSDKVLKCAEPFKKPFNNLKFRQRLERIDDVCAMIIASCVDKQKVKKEGNGYYVDNQDFAHELLNVVNAIKDRLSLKLKIDLKSIDFPEVCELIPDDEERQANLLYFEDPEVIDLAYQIMAESTGRGYERIRKKHNKVRPESQLPSKYILEKNLPMKVMGLQFCMPCSDEEVTVKEDILLGKNYSTSLLHNEEEAMAFFSQTQEEVEETDKESSSASTFKKVIGAKLDGDYLDYVNLMRNKHTTKGNCINDGEDILLINSFDGAEAFKSQKCVGSVVSFSSCLLTSNMLETGLVTAGSSFNILTWLQVIGKEDLKLLTCVLPQDFWDFKRHLETSNIKLDKLPNSKLWCYEVHDAKMLYSMLQHSQWNRIHHPFLLCKCKRTDGLENTNHECDMYNDDSYSHQWKRSVKRWEYKQQKEKKKNQTYDESDHRSWCDEHNFGVTHFGLEPDLFPISHIRFDIFHCKCAIIRRMMTTVRELLMNLSHELRDDFTNNVLKTFWSDFYVFCWNNKLNFSSFKGNELVLFVVHAPKVQTFLEEKLVPTAQVRHIILALSLLKPIFKFLSITTIDDKEKYTSSLNEFEDNVKKMYEYGANTYLANGDVSFYFHCLRFYYPKLAKITFERHKLGLGIFTMQGFERRNKESKNTLKRFSTLNRNSNTLMVNNVRRLLQVYLYEANAY